jgi:hypothetical protein
MRLIVEPQHATNVEMTDAMTEIEIGIADTGADHHATLEADVNEVGEIESVITGIETAEIVEEGGMSVEVGGRVKGPVGGMEEGNETEVSCSITAEEG